MVQKLKRVRDCFTNRCDDDVITRYPSAENKSFREHCYRHADTQRNNELTTSENAKIRMRSSKFGAYAGSKKGIPQSGVSLRKPDKLKKTGACTRGSSEANRPVWTFCYEIRTKPTAVSSHCALDNYRASVASIAARHECLFGKHYSRTKTQEA